MKSHTSTNRVGKSRILLVFLSGAAVLLFILGMRAIRTQMFLARDMQCRGRLAQLRLALDNYHEEYGSYPPACIKNENGEPMHSWRILLLPYFEETTIYNQYNFNEPWDGPNNSKLAESIPESLIDRFRSPHDFDSDSDWTSFVVVLDNCEKPVISPSTSEEGSKIFLVEVHNSSIHWMEPRDISIKHAFSLLAQLSEKQKHVNFVTMDGQVGKLSRYSIEFRDKTKFLRKWLPISNSHLEENIPQSVESDQ